MALERFADVVERFTHGYGNGHMMEPGAETVKQWQEELERAVGRAENLQRMITNPQEPRVGQTPRQAIYKKNKSRLYRYQSKRTHRTPLLFVDCLPRRSEEHTSELQSPCNLVCRLLLEKKKKS